MNDPGELEFLAVGARHLHARLRWPAGRQAGALHAALGQLEGRDRTTPRDPFP